MIAAGAVPSDTVQVSDSVGFDVVVPQLLASVQVRVRIPLLQGDHSVHDQLSVQEYAIAPMSVPDEPAPRAGDEDCSEKPPLSGFTNSGFDSIEWASSGDPFDFHAASVDPFEPKLMLPVRLWNRL